MADAKKAEGSKKGRSIILTLENGKTIKRADHIRNLYYRRDGSRDEEKGMTRSAITNEINKLQSGGKLDGSDPKHKKDDNWMPYQVVFAATKHDTRPVPKAKVGKPAKDEKKAA